MSEQSEVFQNVKARGKFSPDWNIDELQARIVGKIAEELAELAFLFDLPDVISSDIYEVYISAQWYKRKDYQDEWGYCGPKPDNHTDILSELADLQVTLFCLAETFGVDIVKLALEKSQKDIERG